jgi:hypothetical protein
MVESLERILARRGPKVVDARLARPRVGPNVATAEALHLQASALSGTSSLARERGFSGTSSPRIMVRTHGGIA